MSMETEDLSILLHIAHGTGFDLKDGNILLTATLGGNTLETKPVQSSEKIEFNNNLIWETNKKSVKRMKTENLPIKVECYITTTRNGQEIRNLIGYILIPIRGIPIVVSKKAKSSKPHWHKLVGLNTEWKIKKPEVSIFLTISDKVHQSSETNLFDLKRSNSTDSLFLNCTDPVEMLGSQKGLFVELLQEEGLLQVGDKETNCDIFIVKLMFKNAKNLEQMINPEEDMHQLFRFNYNLLGTPAYCALTPKGNGTFSIQEKIAIHFRTSIYSLKEYFAKVFFIPVELFYNDSTVGTARFHFKNLLQVESLDAFLDKYGESNNSYTYENTFPIHTVFDLPPSSPTPYMEYIFSLKYLSTTKVSSCEIIMDKPQRAEYIDNNAGADKNYVAEYINQEPSPRTVREEENQNYVQVREIQSDSVVSSARQPEVVDNKVVENKIVEHKVVEHKVIENKVIENKENVAKTIPVPQCDNSPKMFETCEKTDINTLITEKCPIKTTKDALRTFSFNLNLQTVKFNRRPETGIYQISLHHQNADTSYTIANVELTEVSSNLVEFKNLELQLFFSANLDNIFDVVSSDSCILKINGPRGVHAFAELDNEILLVSTKEKRSGVILMENQNGEKCAMAHIFVYMEDIGLTFNSQIKRYATKESAPSSKAGYLDENLAYQMVEELEEWKQKQQENFLVELKRKEVNHLAMLSIEWQKRKSELENELTCKLEHCTQLSDTLEEAHRALKEKGVDHLEHERVIEKARIEAEQKFEKVTEEFNEKIRRSEEDMVHKMKLEQLKYKELELEKLNIEKEKLSLQKELDDLKKVYDEMKKNYLPREQLAGLFQDVKVLNERLEEVQKSKQFYKEQWAKIIREVHKMKTENLQKIEERIRLCRTTGLQNLLQNEKNEFYSEREELKEVKAALAQSSDDEEDCESCYEFDR